ncbi:alpha/beta hydrolase [Colwellia sp. 75C3]|uniref:alpha/beta fold hydrolase n=1 Tax=Colwellia sp. 75C3 TaxID=888425 RepID=UPI000C34000B|nr:alpha/beta fold hydrolase [Colwellia sp. 75C3]PKG83165.1 alpha/beta hydrolase [Colwellia sp. 75C3]
MINFGLNKHHLLSLAALLTIASANIQANDNQKTTTQHVIYSNENAIIFETMDGIKTDAYEGFITVPENRSNKASRTIPVKYVRFPATGNKNGSPIIYLSGGPGGSGIDTAKYPNFRFPLFMALREFGDVIALDQRGTGASKTAPKCVSSQTLPLTTKLTNNSVTQLYQKSANECVKFWQSEGVDILGYTTTQSALDIDDLRKHLQAKKVTLWGISYGSHLAFSAMKELKGKIDKVVIASAEGLNQTVKLPAETNAYFARLQQAINTQPEAKSAYPDIVKLIHSVHKKLDESPMPMSIPQRGASNIDMLFQKVHLQIIASSMISDPQRGVKHLLMLYKSLEQGSDTMLVEVLKRGYFSNTPISFDAMSFAMDIASGITDERLALVNEQAKTSLLGLALNFPMPHLNKAVTGLDLGDSFREDPISDIPTLLLTGTLDGRTYINSQKLATQGLSNLTQVKVINAGHNLFMVSPEVTEVIKLFLSDKEIATQSITIKLPKFAPQR